MLKTFFKDTDGATAIEYGLIAAGIAVGVMLTVFSLGDNLESMFSGVSDQLTGGGS